MSPETQCLNYVWPEKGAFWHWTSMADAIGWSSGSVLSFYEEIQAVLGRLKHRGLPRFEEVLLILAATRSSWHEPDGGSAKISALFDELGPSPDEYPMDEWRNELLAGLGRVHSLAKQREFGLQTTADILEIVFARHGDHLDADAAVRIADCFSNGMAATFIQNAARADKEPANSDPFTLGWLVTIRNLITVLRDLPEVDLDFFSQTGLPGGVIEAEVEPLPLVERIRNLAGELLADEDHELAGLARIAQSLSAVVQLPRPISDPQEMPMGGYSDIANRGTFDRLLITELAQDPDVLAIRVALNEALYLRRESPPRQPPRRRAIFLDTSIRLWGLPRVFGNALTLAFAMQSDGTAEVEVLTWSESQLQDARLDSKESLIDLLGRLDPAAQSIQAVSEFLARFDDGGDTDLVIITHPRVWSDPDFQRGIMKTSGAAYFLATIDGDGHYELSTYGPAGHRELQRAKLDLEKLLAGSTDQKSPDQLLRNRDKSLPLILRQTPFPLRMTSVLPIENIVYHKESGVVGYTKDGLLLHWPEPHRAAKVLTDQFPRGIVSWRQIDPKRNRVFFLTPRSDRTALLTIAFLNSGDVETVSITHGIEYVQHVCRLDEVIVLSGQRIVSAYRISDGEPAGTLTTSPMVRSFDRFVKYEETWFAIAIGTKGLTLEAVPNLPAADAPELIWEAEGIDVPLMLLKDLSVFRLTDPPEELIGPGGSWFKNRNAVSSDRTRLIVNEGHPNVIRTTPYLIDVSKKTGASLKKQTEEALEPEARRIMTGSTPQRKRYSSIMVYGSKHLAIKTRKGQTYVFTLFSEGVKRLEFCPEQKYEPSTPYIQGMRRNSPGWRHFEYCPTPAGARFGLRQARWSDGSTAYLDNRGFLHLKSSDPRIPETSIVLKDHMLSGWTSDGKHFGTPYYIGDHQPTDAEEIAAEVSRFCRRIIAANVNDHG